MSPDETRRLTGKVDKLFGIASSTNTAVATLATEFRLHREAEEARQELRSATCPTQPLLRELRREHEQVVRDVNAIGGIQRADSALIKGLVEWRESVTLEQKVEDAEQGVLIRIGRYVFERIDKIAVAVGVAYILLKAGL